MIGFGADPNKKGIKISLQKEGINKLIKDYKKVKKYMKSSLYQIKTIDGTETYVSELIKDSEENL
ncbi:hypothetical protein EBS02_01980 [bacterium]|nr:hypothetical protein [bacterium]